MSNYTQTTAFTPKDSLVSGNPAKIIKGSEFDAEFVAIAAAVNSKSDISTTTSELALKVTGPASTTDNTIARYDGTTGKLIQSSSATLDDAGNATFSGNVLGYTVSAAAGMYGVENGFYQGYGLYNDALNWKNTESGVGGWIWRKDDNTLSLLQGSTTGTAGTVVVPVTRLGFDAAGNATFSGKVGIGTTAIPGKKLQIDAAGADAAIRLKETASYGVSWDIDVGSANEMLFTNNAGAPLNYRFNNGNATFTGNVAVKASGAGYTEITYGSPTVSGYVASFTAAGTRKAYACYWNGFNYVLADTDGATDLSIGTNGTSRQVITSAGLTAFNNSIGFGYGTGSGGTVTQATSKSTAVTLNKPSGRITMDASALASGASATFLVNNSTVGVADAVLLSHSSFFTGYRIEAGAIGAGSFYIRVTNITGGSLSEAVAINFSVIKGSTT